MLTRWILKLEGPQLGGRMPWIRYPITSPARLRSCWTSGPTGRHGIASVATLMRVSAIPSALVSWG